MKDDHAGEALLEKQKDLHNESGLLRVSGLSRKVEEVIDHYLAIEEFFLRRSVDRAMKIDEYDAGNQTSSCVDDVFYILKKTISRAVYTSNVDCLAAMINFIKNTLEMDYISVFQRNMASVFSNGDTRDARFQYMVREHRMFIITHCCLSSCLLSIIVVYPHVVATYYILKLECPPSCVHGRSF